MKKYLSLFIGILVGINFAQAQDPGIVLNSPEALESYTLFEGSGASFGDHFLINNCGEVVNTWSIGNVDLHAKLLPTGNLLYMNGNSSTIFERDWDGNIVVSYPINLPNRFYMKYEVIKMPNGNYLILGREELSLNEFEELGWDYSWGFPSEMDAIVEYNPTEDAIVWEWYLKDHIIQELTTGVPTYGVVKDHPELLNMAAVSQFDWTSQESFMINGMDYNPDLDQIALSVRKLGEIALIDHSTTTEEAAGHTGGKHGKGGDIIYRWGSPENYDRATASQKKELYLQHNPKWITSGVHKGKISFYNNNLGKSFPVGQAPYSGAYIIDPPIDENGFYILEDGKPYGPVEPTLQIDSPTTSTFFRSDYGSGVEILPNENIFISNATGRLMEVTMEGKIVWEYQIPFTFFVYRCQKYPLDYPGFDGQDLTGEGQVPGALADDACIVLSTEEALNEGKAFEVYYNPSLKTLRLNNPSGESFDYQLFSLDGQRLQGDQSNYNRTNLDLSDLAAGMYIISLKGEEAKTWESHKIVLY